MDSPQSESIALKPAPASVITSLMDSFRARPKRGRSWRSRSSPRTPIACPCLNVNASTAAARFPTSGADVARPRGTARIAGENKPASHAGRWRREAPQCGGSLEHDATRSPARRRCAHAGERSGSESLSSPVPDACGGSPRGGPCGASRALSVPPSCGARILPQSEPRVMAPRATGMGREGHEAHKLAA
jgi:hypothetical protein